MSFKKTMARAADHQPFNWQGQRVEPYFDNDRGAWGFSFLGLWIPL
jgi:hypothetical protein